MNPDVRASAHNTKVERLGLGYLRHFDLVIAGLDNREARLWVGTSCRKLRHDLGRRRHRRTSRTCPRVRRVHGHYVPCFPVDTDANRPCTSKHNHRIREIAAIQVQEAVKLLVGRDDLVAAKTKPWSAPAR